MTGFIETTEALFFLPWQEGESQNNRVLERVWMSKGGGRTERFLHRVLVWVPKPEICSSNACRCKDLSKFRIVLLSSHFPWMHPIQPNVLWPFCWSADTLETFEPSCVVFFHMGSRTYQSPCTLLQPSVFAFGCRWRMKNRRWIPPK